MMIYGRNKYKTTYKSNYKNYRFSGDIYKFDDIVKII